MMLFISLCHRQSIHCPSNTQENVTVSPQLYPYNNTFAAVSIEFTPPLICFYSHHCCYLNPPCHYNDIHYISDATTTTIVAAPLLPYPSHYGYYDLSTITPPPPYNYVSIIISPPWSPFYHMLFHHCCCSKYAVSVSPCICCTTDVPAISVLNLCIHLHVLLNFLCVCTYEP